METDSPFIPPDSQPPGITRGELKQRLKFWKQVSRVGLALFIVPALFLTYHFIQGITGVFRLVGSVGGIDPSTLSELLGEILILFITASIILLPGLALFLVSAIRLRDLKRQLIRLHDAMVARS